MRKKVDAVGDVLGGLIAGIEAAYPDEGHRIWELWAQTVGPELARRSAPLEFRAGRLTVAVSSSPWLQQMSLMAPQLMEALNLALGAPLVKRMKFRLAEVTPPPLPEPVIPPWNDDPLSEEDQATVDRDAGGVDDPELAEVIRRARAMSLRRLRRKEGA